MNDAGLDLAIDAGQDETSEAAMVYQMKQKRSFVLLEDIEVLPERLALGTEADGDNDGESSDRENDGVRRQTIPAGTYGMLKAFLVQNLSEKEKRRLRRKLLKDNLAAAKRSSTTSQRGSVTDASSKEIQDDISCFSGETTITLSKAPSGTRSNRRTPSVKSGESGNRKSSTKCSIDNFPDMPPVDATGDDVYMPILKLHFFGQGVELVGSDERMDDKAGAENSRSDASSLDMHVSSRENSDEDTDSEKSKHVAEPKPKPKAKSNTRRLSLENLLVFAATLEPKPKSQPQPRHRQLSGEKIDVFAAVFDSCENDAVGKAKSHKKPTKQQARKVKAIFSGTYYYPLYPGHTPLKESFRCI
jgi:hypothetical protein